MLALASSLLLLAAEAATPDALPIGFDEAVARGLQRNPTSQVAVEEIRRAEAIWSEVRAGWLPLLTAGAAYTRLDGDRRIGASIVAARDQISASLTLALPVLAPQRWVASAQAEEQVEMARHNAEDVRRSLATLVARTYISVLTQHRIVESAARARANAQAHFDYAHRRFEGKYGSRLDEVRAAQELATSNAQLESARTVLVRLQESLGVLVGVEQPADATTDPTLPPIPAGGGALDQAIESRADVQLARRQAKLAEMIVRQDWTLHAPALLGIVQPFYQDPPTPTLPHTGWQAQLVLTLPLFEGGLRQAQSREHRSFLGERQLQLEGALRQARAEVRTAVQEVQRTGDALTSAREAARLAEDALSLTTLAYREGATTNIEVVDAERRARDAATAAHAAEDAARQAVLDLLIATGRFPAR